MIKKGNLVSEGPVKPQLQLLPGGKDTDIWLWKLPLGTVFLSKEKGALAFQLMEFQITAKTEKSVQLMVPNYSGGPPAYVRVDPVKFCQQVEKFEILSLGEEEDVEPEGN